MESNSSSVTFRAKVDDVFNDIEPTSDDIKEVYAQFGLAYYHAEVLHRGLCNLYTISQITPSRLVSRYRLEEHLRFSSEMTLGRLLEQMETILPVPLSEQLKLALERRNFLAHHFWYERIHLTATQNGVETMLLELSRDISLFKELDLEVDKLNAPLQQKTWMKPELFEAALNDLKNGNSKALEPLHQQRMPKKQEIIVKVFCTPNSTLVFQTDDGVLWELCDAGLGWSSYQSVDISWLVAKKFASLLPAKINPRPIVSAPWTFEINFGRSATLFVSPGRQQNQITYELRASNP